MAKKAHSAKPGAKTVTLAKAIRQSLGDLGRDANRAQVESWIKQHYPGMKYKEATLNSSLSNIKKKLRGEGGGSKGEPTLNEVMSAKAAAAETGGVEKLLSFVNQADALAKKFGGLDHLRKCVESLKKVRE